MIQNLLPREQKRVCNLFKISEQEFFSDFLRNNHFQRKIQKKYAICQQVPCITGHSSCVMFFYIWKPEPLDKTPKIVYLEIYRVYLEIYENLTSHTRISWYIRVWAKTMTHKLGTVYDFFIMFEYVLRHLPWQYIVFKLWSQKWKNSVKKKNSGNSVHLRIYCHVLSISKYIRLRFVCRLCHAFKLLSIVYKFTDASPKKLLASLNNHE